MIRVHPRGLSEVALLLAVLASPLLVGVGQADEQPRPDPPPRSGVLAGRVVDASGRKLPRPYVGVIDLTAPAGKGTIHLVADDNGYFTVMGLEEKKQYQLWACTRDGDRLMAGGLFAVASKDDLVIKISEDQVLPTTPDVPDRPDGNTRESDQNSLHGVWRLVKDQDGGTTTTYDGRGASRRDIVYVFAGNRVLVANERGVLGGTYRLTPESSPRGIEVSFGLGRCEEARGPDPDSDGTGRLGIYRLDGDRLELCFADKNHPERRPTKFAGDWTGALYLVLERVGARREAAVGGSEATETESRSFEIPVRIDPARRRDCRQIEVVVSDDEGMTWRPLASLSPEARSCSYTAPADGVYWFKVGTYDKEGNRTPPSPTKEPPDLKVRVKQPESGQKSIDSLREEVRELRKRLERLERGAAP